MLTRGSGSYKNSELSWARSLLSIIHLTLILLCCVGLLLPLIKYSTLVVKREGWVTQDEIGLEHRGATAQEQGSGVWWQRKPESCRLEASVRTTTDLLEFAADLLID